MQTLKSSTEETAWVAGNDGAENIYIAYFAERRPIPLSNYRDRPEELRALLSRIRVSIKTSMLRRRNCLIRSGRISLKGIRLSPLLPPHLCSTAFSLDNRPIILEACLASFS